jgi:hypothetical protein
MHAAGLLLLAVVASCWREGTGPAPAPVRPEPAKPAKAAARPRWRQSAAVEPKPPEPKRSPEEVGRQLAGELRANGDQILASYVAGPVVVLDLDTGNLTVECDAAAATLATGWGMLLTDPKRPAPYCRGSQAFTCAQFSSPQVLIVELADPDNWRIVSVIVGNFRSARSTYNTKLSQMRTMVSTATCP